jgi:hypothetical protein
MSTRSLVLIAIRLYALYWLFVNFSGLATLIPMYLAMDSEIQSKEIWSLLAAPLITMILSLALWFCAVPLSKAVTRGQNSELSIAMLSREDLYRFAFVFLGIYFVLSSISTVVHAAYQFIAFDLTLPDTDQHRGKDLVPFAAASLTMFVGFACVLGASKWSRKLMSKDERVS